jgi:hypothetical protein
MMRGECFEQVQQKKKKKLFLKKKVIKEPRREALPTGMHNGPPQSIPSSWDNTYHYIHILSY